MGRFLTKDTWDGNYQDPLTLNSWNYTSSNPINYSDPSGNTSIPYYCLAAFGLAVADGPLPFGDATALVCLLAAAGGATVADYVVNAPEVPGQPRIREIPRMIPLDQILKDCWVVIRPKNQPTPDPLPTVYPPPIPIRVTPPVSTPTNTPKIARVRHYDQQIDLIESTMLIKSQEGLAIWVEHPIITPYEKDAIQETTASFMRALNGHGGFVEFNVDLNKWRMEPDPNLPWVSNAKIIWLGGPGNLPYIGVGFPLHEPGVDPVFFDWQGKRK